MYVVIHIKTYSLSKELGYLRVITKDKVEDVHPQSEGKDELALHTYNLSNDQDRIPHITSKRPCYHPAQPSIDQVQHYKNMIPSQEKKMPLCMKFWTFSV